MSKKTSLAARAVAAAATALLTLGLAACGGSSGSTAAGGGGGSEALTLGFAQVGAESGWRTANTKSIQDSAGRSGRRPEVLRRAAEAGEPDQGDPLLHPAEGRRHRVQPGRHHRLGHGAAGGQAGQHPRDPHRPRRRHPRQTLYKTFLGSDFVAEGKKAGDWLVEQEKGATGPVAIVAARGHHRLRPGHRPHQGLRRRDRGQPEPRRSSRARPVTSPAPAASR